MKSSKPPGLVSMGQIVHGSDNGENMYIYLTYPDLESAFKFSDNKNRCKKHLQLFKRKYQILPIVKHLHVYL